ncbi:MAG TPA: hypothetical protein VHC70_12815 [Phycisphaerales bacterium]|jgi:hypothetical protein|nr:hypothetical protein [Phycisphaerales bacterium]
MQPSAEQLVVRQHERIHCRIASQLRVASENAEQVSLARAIGDGSGGVDAFITDCSRGGLGIESSVFFPRGCRLRIKARTVGAPQESAGAGEMVVRVQRVTMLDRKPSYYLGVSFVSKGLEHDAAVTALLDAARKAPAAVSPAKPNQPAAAPGKEVAG